MQLIRDLTTGFLIGLANLIPGVSGGTFALILGLYERLITFLNSINARTVFTFFRLLFAWLGSGFKKAEGNTLMAHLRENDYPFMAVLAIGAMGCILAMSSLMKYLLIHQFTYTYGYFFGLILLSVAVPWRMIQRVRPSLLLPLLIGLFLTVGISANVDPYEKALNKSNLLEQQYLLEKSADKQEAMTDSGKFIYIGKYTPGEYLYIFFCGIVAISAMVLPGISGSLVLILMNQYFAVISAIANISSLLLDDLLFLGCMAAGIIFGLLSFARIIKFMFNRFHDPTVAFLIGLIIGSLYSLWPFKQANVIDEFFVKEGRVVEMIENHTVYSNVNILPQDSTTALMTGVAILLGIITMGFFLAKELKRSKA